jgi:hypothetical protein
MHGIGWAVVAVADIGHPFHAEHGRAVRAGREDQSPVMGAVEEHDVHAITRIVLAREIRGK